MKINNSNKDNKAKDEIDVIKILIKKSIKYKKKSKTGLNRKTQNLVS